MEYSFDIEEAKKYGLKEAIMLKNFKFWIAKNKVNGEKQFEGRTWTFNSIAAFKELFPFWTENQIRTILQSLLDQNVLISGNFNKQQYDRTKWYALAEEESLLNEMGKTTNAFDEKQKSICEKTQMDLRENPNGFVKNPKPIPDNKPDIKNTDNKPDNIERGKIKNFSDRPTKFIIPSLEEVKQYCQERNNGVNPERFIDFYSSKGWYVGKNKMKDWKAAVRTWEQRDSERGINAPPAENSDYPEEIWSINDYMNKRGF